MQVTYIKHSGFAIEWEECIWVFDYYKGRLPEWDKKKPLFIFASHAHEDHFNPEIFNLFSDYEQVNYILSSDIKKKTSGLLLSEDIRNKIATLDVDERLTLPVTGSLKLEVKTLDSTDCGVSFLVKYKERYVFHAGDLNCWVWDDDSKAERNNMISRFKREIDKLEDIPIELAFLPLDPRLGVNYDMGVRYFLDHVKADHIFPMHLWERYDTVRRFRDSLETRQMKERVTDISYPGQRWEFADS